jgi:hypothetical protein
MAVEHLQCLSFRYLTRFNGFELLAWDFNPRWAMRSSVSTNLHKPTLGKRASRFTLEAAVVYAAFYEPSLPPAAAYPAPR